MRLYLDQCLRSELAERLRHHGHDVVRAAEVGQARSDDAMILERATRDERTLITWINTLAIGRSSLCFPTTHKRIFKTAWSSSRPVACAGFERLINNRPASLGRKLCSLARHVGIRGRFLILAHAAGHFPFMARALRVACPVAIYHPLALRPQRDNPVPESRRPA